MFWIKGIFCVIEGLDVIGGMSHTSDQLNMNSDHFTDEMDGETMESGKMSPQPSHKSSKGITPIASL